MVLTVGEGKPGLEMILLPASRTVGAHKHCLPPSVFAPLPLSPWKHSSSPIFLCFGQVWGPPPGHYLLTAAHRRGTHLCGRLAAAPFPPGHGGLGPRAPLRAPSPASALSKGTDTIPRSHSHVRPAAPGRGPLPAAAGTVQLRGPRCGARLR